MNELYEAIVKQNLERIVELIDKGVDVQKPDHHGRTALMQATIEGSIEILLVLIQAGANINVCDRQGFTALHFAAQAYQVEAARLLLKSGAIVDALDVNGNTPLWRAVFDSRGRGAIVEQLLLAGANRNLKNKSGVSPFDLAYNIANYDVKQFIS